MVKHMLLVCAETEKYEPHLREKQFLITHVTHNVIGAYHETLFPFKWAL